MMKPEKFGAEMTDPSGITGNEWCLVCIVVAVWNQSQVKYKYCTYNICPSRLLLQFICGIFQQKSLMVFCISCL